MPATGPDTCRSPDRASGKREEVHSFPSEKLLLYLVNDKVVLRAEACAGDSGQVVAITQVGDCATVLNDRGTTTRVCRDGRAASQQPSKVGPPP
jgi:hypothetical protein